MTFYSDILCLPERIEKLVYGSFQKCKDFGKEIIQTNTFGRLTGDRAVGIIIFATKRSLYKIREDIMGKDTKDRILDEALICFAENGYKGTNLRDFAAGMGLSKSALYSHFESKEAIWNALLDKMEAYYAERLGSAANLPEPPDSCDELYSMTMRMVDFTVHDEKIILTRKLLLTEQFHDERVKKLATEHFINGTKAIFKAVFEKMTENGILKKNDPELLAFIYTSPITSLIHYCDREPEKEPEIIRNIEAFVKHFITIYRTEKYNAD